MFRVANSSFDALEGDSGKIGAFADDCVRHENGSSYDGTRRGAPVDAPPSMLQNLVTMETFSVRGGLIHHVEAAPFVTLPYGLGNGWTPGSGR